MRADPGAKMLGEHLCAKADAEERPFLAQGHRHPVDLCPQMRLGVVGAGRATEDDGPAMPFQRRRQTVSQNGSADVETNAGRVQNLSDTTRRGGFLMQYDKDRARIDDCVQRVAPLGLGLGDDQAPRFAAVSHRP